MRNELFLKVAKIITMISALTLIVLSMILKNFQFEQASWIMLGILFILVSRTNTDEMSNINKRITLLGGIFLIIVALYRMVWN